MKKSQRTPVRKKIRHPSRSYISPSIANSISMRRGHVIIVLSRPKIIAKYYMRNVTVYFSKVTHRLFSILLRAEWGGLNRIATTA